MPNGGNVNGGQNRLSFESLEPRVLLATVNWAVNNNGFWDVGSNWSTGFAPQPGDDVVLDRPAGDFTITHRSGTTNVSSITSEERLVASGGVLDVSGTIQISNDFVLSGATVKNASVLAGSGGEGVIVTSSSENRLSGVTLEGDLDLSANTATLHISNGLTFNGTITLSGSGARLSSDTTQTIDGTGTIAFVGTTGGTRRLTVEGSTTLTLARTS